MGGRGRGRGLCHLRLQLYGHDGGKEDKDLLEWSGQLTGQRHLAQHSAFSTGNQISFPSSSCLNLYMEIGRLLRS